MSYLDISIIVIYLLVSLVLGLYFTKSASISTSSFFLGGRNLPWWLAGTSMVATTFAADTPLLVTELVATKGISGNWLWWNGMLGGMIAVFLFAKYWRRAEIITDVELVEIRYSGKEASFLRGFKAIYLGVLMNGVIMAWVNVALGDLMRVFFDLPQENIIYYLAAAMFLVVIYSALSGLTGVAVTDFVQFWLAMLGTIVLAYLVLQSDKIGGLRGLQEKLPASTLSFFPQISSYTQGASMGLQLFSISLATFFSYIAIQWWASWYPGSEPGGGGYIAQRMMSVKTEADAIKATLFFQIAHYTLRPWAWILVGLCTLVLYPNLPEADKKLGYVMAMKDFLPDGLKGLLLVSFLAAYMSTISTQLNWGTSYVINDFYARFIEPKASQKQLVNASRWATLMMMLVALLITTQIKTLNQAFEFMITASAGLGGVLMLRWYWWRINAWSEITATLAPFLWLFVVSFFNLEKPYDFLLIVFLTTLSWIIATFITQPTDLKTLTAFYLRVRPEGFWKPFENEKKEKNNHLLYNILASFSATLLGYSILFSIGYLLFPSGYHLFIWIGIAFLGLISLRYFGKKGDIWR
ncbi:MAG: sodium:proline symporter [Bacteroidetes bacterium]|nr:MAG: sodium:proline symporter [Bacteroidota bacterium]TAG90250.1 MAG: sodium:proline symporter [Bacteroidota bacterium]